MTTKRKWPLRVVLAVLLTTLLGTGCTEDLPKDQALIESFQRHRDSFDQLAHIALVESAEHPDTYIVWIPDSDSTKARLNADAMPLIKSLRAGRVFATRGRVVIPAAGFALLSTEEKGWEFVSEGGKPPAPNKVVSSLDDVVRDLQPYDTLYRSLGDGWYLYLQSLTD